MELKWGVGGLSYVMVRYGTLDCGRSNLLWHNCFIDVLDTCTSGALLKG